MRPPDLSPVSMGEAGVHAVPAVELAIKRLPPTHGRSVLNYPGRWRCRDRRRDNDDLRFCQCQRLFGFDKSNVSKATLPERTVLQTDRTWLVSPRRILQDPVALVQPVLVHAISMIAETNGLNDSGADNCAIVKHSVTNPTVDRKVGESNRAVTDIVLLAPNYLLGPPSLNVLNSREVPSIGRHNEQDHSERRHGHNPDWYRNDSADGSACRRWC